MRIAIELNDTLRAFSRKFADCYGKYKDSDIDLDDVELSTNDLSEVFEFDSKEEYNEFLYVDYAFEIFGAAEPMDKNLPALLKSWLNSLNDYEGEAPTVSFVGIKEGGLAITSTLFFLSKCACPAREILFPIDSTKTWDLCDVLITANPDLLKNKPEDKISIKINMPYNKDIESDYSFNSLIEMIEDTEKINNILKLEE